MTDSMRNRGPDGAGSWIGDDARVGFAHRRLAIIDPTAASDQPMISADGSLTIVFNGEIYNYAALRASLEAKGHRFRTRGDTEVLLQMYQEYGDAMLPQLRGMYAFAIWDSRTRRLFMARDPLGIKPLYYCTVDGVLYFSSQVRTLQPLLTKQTPDPVGQVGFLVWGSVPEPYTFVREIRSIPAGHSLTCDPGAQPRLVAGETITDALLKAAALPPPSAGARSEMLRTALKDSIAAHTVSDVPVALFLSAGMDSTTIAGLASEIPGQNLKALSLGFDVLKNTPADETILARQIADLYSIPFYEELIGKHDFSDEYDRLFTGMDQPTIDGINVYFVARMARRAGYKVALSGVGGDELFGGYPSFHQVPRMQRLFGWAGAVPSLGRGFRWVSAKALQSRTSPKYAGLLEYGHNIGGAYLLRRGLFMPWELPEILDPSFAGEGWAELQQLDRFEALLAPLKGLPNQERLSVTVLEMSAYMRNQLLRDCDWAGMVNSVEIRTPLVDMELVRQLAPLLVHGNPPGKRDMASTPSRPLPATILNRPKTGFSIPVREWLAAGAPEDQKQPRGLRGWAQQIFRRFADSAVASEPAGVS